MQKERTFVMIKPGAVQRGLVGEIVGRFEKKGLKLVAMKLVSVSRELAEKHYDVHRGKPFFEPTVKYITSSPVIAMVLEGNNAIEMVRGMTGATDPQKAEPGTIRGDYGQFIGSQAPLKNVPVLTKEQEIRSILFRLNLGSLNL